MVINLDWLEVFALENIDVPLSPDMLKRAGMKVQVRDYGTPQYQQMLTVFGDDGFPLLEVRRLPYSLKRNGGIFEDNACHIRLCNRACYMFKPVEVLRDFMRRFRVEFVSLSRVDFCCDFLTFANRYKVTTFIRDYLERRVAKINQPNISMHGREEWEQLYINSLKWGSPSSIVTTKLYDKTLELSRDGHGKPWIEAYWLKNKLCSLQTVVYDYYNKKDKVIEKRLKVVPVPFGTERDEVIPIDSVERQTIWRVEFSVNVKGSRVLDIDTGEVFKMSLSDIDDEMKLARWFFNLSGCYFRFVRREVRNGKVVRKDRCPAVQMWKSDEISVLRLKKLPEREMFGRTDRMLVNRLTRLAETFDNLTDKQRAAMAFCVSALNRCVMVDRFGAKDNMYRILQTRSADAGVFHDDVLPEDFNIDDLRELDVR